MRVGVWLVLCAVVALGGWSLVVESSRTELAGGTDRLSAEAFPGTSFGTVASSVPPSDVAALSRSLPELAATQPNEVPGLVPTAAGANKVCPFKVVSDQLEVAGKDGITKGKSGVTICVTPKQTQGALSTLPAWRWEDLSGLSREGGGVVGSAMTGIAGMFFAIAGLIWRITLFFVYLSTVNTWLTDSAYTINHLFVRFLDTGALLIAAAWFILLARSSGKALKGDIAAIGRAIVIFLIPAGLLLAMYSGAKRADAIGTTAMEQCQGVGSDVYARYGGSSQACEKDAMLSNASVMAEVPMNPLYLVQQVQDVFDTATESFTDVWTTGAGGREKFETSVLSGVGMDQDPNCAGYIYGLVSMYRALTSEGAKNLVSDPNSQRISVVYDQNARIILTHASLAWVAGLYEPWSQGEFGDTQLRGVAACHLLDETNEVPAFDQQTAMGLAYPELVQSLGPQPVSSVGVLVAGHPSVYRTVNGADKLDDINQDKGCDNNSGGMIAANAAGWAAAGFAAGVWFGGVTGVVTGAIGGMLGAAAALVNDGGTLGVCLPTGLVSVVRDLGKEAIQAGAKAVAGAVFGKQTKFADQGSVSEAERAERQLRMMNWAACRWDNSGGGRWVADPRWVAVGKTSIGVQDGLTDDQIFKYASGMTKDAPESAYCKTRWVYGHGMGEGDKEPFKDAGKGDPSKVVQAPEGINAQLGRIGIDDSDEENAVAKATTLHGISSPSAERSLNNYQGRAVGNRLVYGLASILGAIAYFFMIGGPALGLLLATFGLIVLLAVLPLLLGFMAAGSGQAKKGGRLILGLIATKSLFTILILLVVELQLVVMSVLTTIDASGVSTGVAGAGIFRSLAVMFSPLIVLVMMNKILKAMGLQKLNSIGGALGLLGAVSAMAAGAGSMAGFLSPKIDGRKWGKRASSAIKGTGKRGRAMLPERLRDFGLRGQLAGSKKKEASLTEKARLARLAGDESKAQALEAKRDKAAAQSKAITAKLEKSRAEAQAVRDDMKSKGMSLVTGGAGVLAGAGALALPPAALLAAGAVGGGGYGALAARTRVSAAQATTRRINGARRAVPPDVSFGRSAQAAHELTPSNQSEITANKEWFNQRMEWAANDVDAGRPNASGRVPSRGEAKSRFISGELLACAEAQTGEARQLTQAEMNGLRDAYSQQNGVNPEHVMVSRYGVVMPNPDLPESERGALRNHPVFRIPTTSRAKAVALRTEEEKATYWAQCMLQNGTLRAEGGAVRYYASDAPQLTP